MKLPSFAEVRKAAAAAAGLAAQVVALGFLSGTILHDVQIGIAVLTVVSVFAIRNAQSAAEPPAQHSA